MLEFFLLTDPSNRAALRDLFPTQELCTGLQNRRSVSQLRDTVMQKVKLENSVSPRKQ